MATELSIKEMSNVKDCGCKGCRRCLICAPGGQEDQEDRDRKERTFHYSCASGLAVAREGSGLRGFPFPGVTVCEEFVSCAEEERLAAAMGDEGWKPSQSGRRKQDFGPKVNFKRRKVKAACFTGLPPYARPLVERMGERLPEVLGDFRPVEECNLEYARERGASIDPHFDDSWLWGERLVTLNLLADISYTMTTSPDNDVIELRHVDESEIERSCLERVSVVDDEDGGDVAVRIFVPRRSLVVLAGPARHAWMHAIRRGHVMADLRLCATFRELSDEFREGGQRGEEGERLLAVASTYAGTPVI